MLSLRMMVICITVVALTTISAFATGNVEKGKMLFSDPGLGQSKNNKSCASCHPGGSGLMGVTQKKQFKTPAGASKTLETAVNQCIKMALGGKALKPEGDKMQDLIAYLTTLKPQE